ncbi:MAG: hypothetical protein K0V04_16520, partial [Deltaproteobacteria bacterium]|nr:hypothetical protein [Deltaproteobacteria bacterium]
IASLRGERSRQRERAALTVERDVDGGGSLPYGVNGAGSGNVPHSPWGVTSTGEDRFPTG